MQKLKKLIIQTNKIFNSSIFIRILLIISWVLLITTIVSFIIIKCNEEFIILPTSQGFNNIFEIYKFPLTLLASLIAIISLRIALIRVAQTDKQLESSYKPELFVNKEELFFHTRKDGEFVNQFVFTTTGMFNEPPQLTIYNVGLAVAKEIKYHFEYDIDKALRMLHKFNTDNHFIIDFSDGLLIIKSEKINYKGSSNVISAQNRERVSNFLLPTSDGKINLKVNLPSYYCELFALYLYLELNSYIKEKDKEISQRNIDESNFPILKMRISCKDLGGKTLQKVFEIRFIVPFFLLPIVNGVFRDTDNKFIIEPNEVI